MAEPRQLPVAAVEVRERSRAVRNLDSLAESIKARGLLHPVVVREDGGVYVLVAGLRRLEAVRALGWARVPVTVASSVGDELSALLAEGEENTEREPFTPEEAVRHRQRIHDVMAAEAEQAHREGSARGGRAQGSSNLDEPSEPEHKRTTRARTAKATGYSATTLDKAAEVVKAAEDPDTPAPVREVAKTAVAEMNATGKVDPAVRKVRQAAEDEALAAIGVTDDATINRMKLLGNAYKCGAAVRSGLIALNTDRLAEAIALDDTDSAVARTVFADLAADVAAWHDRLTAALTVHDEAARPNVTVLKGGRS